MMGAVIGIFVFILYAFLIGFVLVMMYRLVKAFERIADKVEEGITIKREKRKHLE